MILKAITIGTDYNHEDAAPARGMYQGCALGSAHQYPINQHYVMSGTPYHITSYLQDNGPLSTH